MAVMGVWKPDYQDKLLIYSISEYMHLTASLGISKFVGLATMSQQAYAC